MFDYRGDNIITNIVGNLSPLRNMCFFDEFFCKNDTVTVFKECFLVQKRGGNKDEISYILKNYSFFFS